MLFANGMTAVYIASQFSPPISVRTLQKHYRHELNTAKDRIRAQIGANVVKKALGQYGRQNNLPDNACMFFWLKCNGGPQWQEVKRPPPGDDDAPAAASPPVIIRVTGGFGEPTE